MNHQSQNSIVNGAGGADAETTLRLIAALPAPAGLEDRIHARLGSAAGRANKPGRMLAWPASSGSGSSWLRSAAAAAIAFVVVSVGWGIYSHVQPAMTGRVVPMPARGEATGGFAGAGAIRTPQTLNGPILAHPVKHQDAPAKTQKNPVAKGAVSPRAAAPGAALDAH
jgi:hypothetical protein